MPSADRPATRPESPTRPPGPRRALVTGASSGIGEAAARALARDGWDVAVVARRGERLELLAKEIEHGGRRAVPIVADLADEAATARAAREAVEGLGGIDLLVNNAGYSPGAAIEQFSRDQLRHIFDVNLLSALQLIGAVTPVMRVQGGGRIVNVGSLAAAVPAPLAIPYGASKIAMHAATDALRLELARFGIQLALVIPGFVDTAVFDNAREGAQHLREDPANPYRQTMFDLDELAAKNLKNPLSPDDVAKVILEAANARKPRARYYTPFSAKLQSVLFGVLPSAWADAILMRVYKLR
ncbi:MAG TPA: SDR family NAD(P)-dependent oxidoreductase [Myxococcota bacterium]|nr:SDR family NAD(P)-dependent oxidoreductase [Myxococcota bacterium]